MLEVLDIRTLILTNFLLGIILGSGLLLFAKAHPTLNGFRYLGAGYFSLAVGFLLIMLRSFIPDFMSIVLANSALFIGLGLVGVGLLRFLGLSPKHYLMLSSVSTAIVLFSFSYFFFVNDSIRYRTIIFSPLFAINLGYLAYKMRDSSEFKDDQLLRMLYWSFGASAAIFALRCVWAVFETSLPNDIVQTSMTHSVALIVFQILIIEICFMISWSGSLDLERSLRILAMVDPLTQLYNRRALQDLAEKEASRAKRKLTSLAAILIDIDHFKKINDNYGHLAGDRVLRNFASAVKANIRSHDILARYGGEEFLLLLPDTNAEKANKIAEKLKSYVAKEPVISDDCNQPIYVTASFGVSAMHGENVSWTTLVEFADSALYQAKRAGRNLVRSNFEYVNLMTR